MSLLTKAGITKLSELSIDVSKDWATYLIKNIGAAVDDNDAVRKAQAILQESMSQQGDIIYRGADNAVRLAPNYGVGYNFLHAKNTGVDEPEWLDIQDIVAYLTGAVNRMIAPSTLVIPTPGVSLAIAEDHSGGGFTFDKTLIIPTPSIGVPTAATYLPTAVDGAIADDGGIQTDETTEANNATANDMTLLPPVPAVDDAYYFGLSSWWDWLSLNIGQAGAGTWTIVWEYYNGSTWVSLPSCYDTSNGFRNGGYQSVTFDRPSDWVTSTILLLALYWIRARVSSYTSITTQPLGTQAWIGTH